MNYGYDVGHEYPSCLQIYNQQMSRYLKALIYVTAA